MFHPRDRQFESGPTRVGQNNGSATILVVDDCQEVLEALTAILKENNYSVAAAQSAIEALKMIALEPPDLILSDWMMPEGDGMYFHEEVRRNPALCDVPFVFLTAVTSDAERQLAKLNGCDDYVTKPFIPEDLLAVIGGKLSIAKRRKKIAQNTLDTHYRRIIHTLSHEFRTPLVSINTGTEVLRDQFRHLPPEQVKLLLDSIWRGGQRLERLVEDFMTLQQIDLGVAAQCSEQYRSRLPLFSLVESAVEGFVDRLPTHSIPPRVRVSHKLGERRQPGLVEVYDVQVNDVLQRLLCNAYKFGGHQNEIDVQVYYDGDTGMTLIRDYGPGFQADGGGVFEPFRQLNRDQQEQQGVGVGLTIARFLSNLNGVELELQAPVDGPGVEAKMAFPLVA